jgi:hypothetical protein
MRTDDTINRVVFLLAMAMLGVAIAVVLMRNPGWLQWLQPKPQPPAARHHTLDSPYGGDRFQRGQPQSQTNTGAARAFPALLARAYRGANYDWLSVTDVNTVTPPKTYTVPGLVTVPSADAAYTFGHFLAFGADHIEQAATPQAAIDWIHNDAAAAFIARPLQPPAMDYATMAGLRGLDGIQVFDARLAKDDAIHADATQLWDRLLTDHHTVWGIVGDDSIDDHGADSVVGQTSVDVQAQDLTPPLIEDALRRGAFVDTAGVRVLSVSTAADTVTVVTTNANQIQFIGSGGKVRKTVNGSRGDYKVDWSEGYIRGYATNQAGGRAWTQPIIVNP